MHWLFFERRMVENLMATPRIRNPERLELSGLEQALLQKMFQDFSEIEIRREFGQGFSDSRVFLVSSRRPDDTLELPTVVKIAPLALIQQELKAFQQFGDNRLPGLIPIRRQLTSGVGEDVHSQRYGALCYQLAGSGLFDIESLRSYCRHADVEDIHHLLINRLFPRMDKLWRPIRRGLNIQVRTSYDRVLPVNLVARPLAANGSINDEPLTTLDANRLDAITSLSSEAICPGARARLKNFMVTEVVQEQHEVTLDAPSASGLAPGGYRVRLKHVEAPDAYRVGDPAPVKSIEVLAVRRDMLRKYVGSALGHAVDLTQNTLSLPGDGRVRLPNPLHSLSSMMEQTLRGNLAVIHGDLNLENILVDPGANEVHLIDCTAAREDHVLHDLAHLEAEIVIHLLSETFFEAGLSPDAIYPLYAYLHCVARSEPHPPGQFAVPSTLDPWLKKPFLILSMIRRKVRDHLYDPINWREYDYALVSYLIGALKFVNLDRKPIGQEPKALAFWAAATLLSFVDGGGDCRDVRWKRMDISTETDGDKDERGRREARETEPAKDRPDFGIYFDGGGSVEIKGDVISGEVVNKNVYYGSGTDSIHAGDVGEDVDAP